MSRPLLARPSPPSFEPTMPAWGAHGLDPRVDPTLALPGLRDAPAADGRRRPSLLTWTLLASALIHVALLVFKVVDPQGFDRIFHSQPLEVILVNARGDDRPAQAKVLAQTSMAGGGDLTKGRSTSPLPMEPQVALGDSHQDTRQRAETLRSEQQQLLAQVRRELAALPPPDPQREAGDPQQHAVEEHRRQLLKLLAEIERRVNDDSERPRQRYISPATQEVAYALYYDALRRRIEQRGTRDFPTQDGRKLYGELTMNITVDARGQVLATEVVRSSGAPLLDRRAEAIVRAAAPFGPFSSRMLAEADQIVVSPHFRFTHDAGLATSMSVPLEPAASAP